MFRARIFCRLAFFRWRNIAIALWDAGRVETGFAEGLENILWSGPRWSLPRALTRKSDPSACIAMHNMSAKTTIGQFLKMEKPLRLWHPARTGTLRKLKLESEWVIYSDCKSSEIKWNQMKSNEIKWSQTKSSEIKWKQIHSSYPTLVGLIGILIASVITAGPGPWPTQISKACIHDNLGPTAGVEASVLMNQIENSDEFYFNFWNLT